MKRGDPIEVRHGSGTWLPGRVELVHNEGEERSPVDLVLADGYRLRNVPRTFVRHAVEQDVPSPREIAIRVAMMPTERADRSHDVNMGLMLCEAPNCGKVRGAVGPASVLEVRVTHGGDTEPWTLRVLFDGWTIADDVADVVLCPDHSRAAHRWLDAFLEASI